MEISEVIKAARIQKGMTQQEVADSVYVTRQTISKWELGKSIPDEASLGLLYQCLDIDREEKRIIKKQIISRQNLCLLIIAVLFSPAVIGIRFCLFKIGKLEDRRFQIWVQSIGFVLFAFYLRTLKEHIACIFIFAIAVGYLAYRYYLLGLEKKKSQED